MAESVPVHCPACRREHLYAAPSYPCVCGTPVAPPLDRGAAPLAVTHHTWDEDWVMVRCGACGREDQWPHPELGCPCGTVLRIPVEPMGAPDRQGIRGAGDDERGPDGGGEGPSAGTGAGNGTEPGSGTDTENGTASRSGTGSRHGSRTGTGKGSRAGNGPRPRPGPSAPRPTGPPHFSLPRTTPATRPAFQPVTIRTARDAVTAAALYLRWLGYQDIRRAGQRPPSGVGLTARGMVAQVDPTIRPASLRDVECLWLTAMTESADCVYFSLAGYADDARDRADSLSVPLFVLDLTGTPQPVNSPADELATGA